MKNSDVYMIMTVSRKECTHTQRVLHAHGWTICRFKVLQMDWEEAVDSPHKSSDRIEEKSSELMEHGSKICGIADSIMCVDRSRRTVEMVFDCF